MSRLLKGLLYKHEDPVIPRTRVKKLKADYDVHSCDPSAEEVQTGGSLEPLASQSNGETQARERPHFKNAEGA